MFVVPCICTQCAFHGNKSNFNARIYVIMTILNTNLGLSQISPQRMYQFDCVIMVIFMINSSKSHLILPPSLIYPLIPLIYHLFIFIYKISICFNLFFIYFTLLTYLCLYILYLFCYIIFIYFNLSYLLYFIFIYFTYFIREFYCEPAWTNRADVGVVWNVEFRSVIRWKHMKTNTIPIYPEQFKSIVPLPLNGVCLHVMSVRDMTIFGLGVHFPKRLLLKQYNLEYRPILDRFKYCRSTALYWGRTQWAALDPSRPVRE